jgi:hypothetical protein
VQFPGLARNDNLFRLPGGAVVEVDPTIDALVSIFLALGRSGADQSERPPR